MINEFVTVHISYSGGRTVESLVEFVNQEAGTCTFVEFYLTYGRPDALSLEVVMK